MREGGESDDLHYARDLGKRLNQYAGKVADVLFDGEVEIDGRTLGHVSESSAQRR
jgi:hypothetical protein